MHPPSRRRFARLGLVLPCGMSLLAAAILVTLAGCGAHAAVEAKGIERALPEPGEVSPRRPH